MPDRSETLRFDGRVAVVTGAGRGLGRAYARMLGQRGAAVVVNDFGGRVDGSLSETPEDAAGAVVAEIEAAGGTASANYADVSDPAQAETVVTDAIDRYGRIDIVVPNAGIVWRAAFGESRLQELDALLAVHLRGTYVVCRAAWPHMAGQGYGRIVTVISSALYGIDRSATYAAAKGGNLGLSKVMAMEGADFGIKVNMVSPVAYTRMTASGRVATMVRSDDPGLSPDGVAALVAVLAHETCPSTGEMFIASGAHVSRLFLAESSGYGQEGRLLTPESVIGNWDTVMSTEAFSLPGPRLEGVISAAATQTPLQSGSRNTRVPESR